jgi:hypothetical protein
MKPLEELATEIRGAIAANEFVRARGLWTTYAARIGEELKAPGAARRMEEARLLVEWARQTVLVARARALEDWGTLEIRRHYSTRTNTKRHSVQISG